MKKINKILSCLLACTIFSIPTFTSVSAMKKSISQFSKEMEDYESDASSVTETTMPTMELQTEESMRLKKQDFLLQHQRILEKKGFYTEDIHKWKYKVFLYLKILYKQLHDRPGTITGIKILVFFLSLVKDCNHVSLPNFDQNYYTIRFEPFYNVCGAIICTPANDPQNIVAVL